jgi:hypothetical protein
MARTQITPICMVAKLPDLSSRPAHNGGSRALLLWWTVSAVGGQSRAAFSDHLSGTLAFGHGRVIRTDCQAVWLNRFLQAEQCRSGLRAKIRVDCSDIQFVGHGELREVPPQR